jgi:hypothetical protein
MFPTRGFEGAGRCFIRIATPSVAAAIAVRYRKLNRHSGATLSNQRPRMGMVGFAENADVAVGSNGCFHSRVGGTTACHLKVDAGHLTRWG